ncbi:Plant organelle RNA recognition domain-containing protein [Artemisia annua]|uniref:Plant organelle RNA recognition domain-containing protein n=1 Tax=Artemisia annua TaxID=35608 RepID=A0A2U1NGW3_ARTAN|nr:Plant organelle RNA recognition domain-containing protein [Artemisia annua]
MMYVKVRLYKVSHHKYIMYLRLKNTILKSFGELMQQGLHEYNRKHHMLNLEKRRKKGMIAMKEVIKDPIYELSDDEEARGDDLGGIFDPEERKRFYKVLFDLPVVMPIFGYSLYS